jgi:pimeloyl-ACP methyl ester carboxylesterase
MVIHVPVRQRSAHEASAGKNLAAGHHGSTSPCPIYSTFRKTTIHRSAGRSCSSCTGLASEEVCAIKHVPIWAFHGDQDNTVRLEYAAETINALKACGGNVKFTVYPGVGHDS